MRSTPGFAALPSILIFALAGCSSGGSTQDELASDPGNPDAVETTARVADDAYTYFEIAADARKCASPMCGGWFVSRLNRATTQCHDGRYAASCYTPVLDWSQAKLSDVQQAKLLDACREDTGAGVYAIVRGQFARTNTTPHPELGRFVVSEAWVAEGDAVSAGVFVRVKDNGVRCFAAPCPSVTETTLNQSRAVDIAEVDWAPAALTDRQVEACIDAMFTPDGLLIAGDRYTVQDNGTSAKARTATAAYHRLADQ